MYQKIRIAVVLIVATMICMLSSTATLSYFTDTEIATNDFTVGNASTSLAIFDDITAENKRELDSSNYPPLTDTMEIPFYLQGTNDGNIPVYQRFRIVIPTALASVITLNLPNMNNCAVETTPEHKCSNDSYIVTYNPSVEVENEPKYAEYYITSINPLGLNDKTIEWPTEKLNFNGITDSNKTLLTCENNDNNSCALGINVYSDSIQTTGFTDAENAFANFAETYN
ncbi:SipW-dependent-type signal peptide-containing protein [Candidatus Saccharibacteria bacterium]|nr:SipW-dependent-type signal peptide-containing protein [Candidatus Saccharibacteria bacterium]